MLTEVITPQIFDYFLKPYENYFVVDIVLEFIAVFLGILSVVYAKMNKIAVYPTGMISTGIFVYLLFQFELFGDMIINAYFFFMSIYGWYYWSHKNNGENVNKVSYGSTNDYIISLFIFLISLILISNIYKSFNLFTFWTAYVDTITTGIFFVAMWLMARRKIESWIFWIIGDIISIPLYFYKGLAITTIQYFIFTMIAIMGYISWKKIYKAKITV
jgi:nicotinamide mononucleotide transporter